MSIAKKLTTIAENEQKVFNAGYDKGNNVGYSDGYKEGYETSTFDFWNVFQKGGERRKYSYAFYEWQGENLTPEFDIIINGNGTNYFYRTFFQSKIKSINKPIRISGNGNNQQALAQATNLETITLLDVTDYTGVFTGWFTNDTALKNIIVVGTIATGFDISPSPLTKDSIMSIFNAATTENAITISFSLDAVNTAFETSAGTNDGSTSDEWETLIATKTNVTVSLV